MMINGISDCITKYGKFTGLDSRDHLTG